MKITDTAVVRAAILNQKVDESYDQIAREKRWWRTIGTVEIVVLFVSIAVFVFSLKFVFWGAGYSILAPAHHNYSVVFLSQTPGPHQALVQRALDERGYLSLVQYRTYVDMAHRQRDGEQAPALTP